MEAWAQLIESIAWPLVLLCIFLHFRTRIEFILDAIKTRIEEGSAFDVGPGGMSLGEAPQLPEDPSETDLIDDVDDVDDGSALVSSSPFENSEASSSEKEEWADAAEYAEASAESSGPVAGAGLRSLELVHQARFLRMKNGRAYYRIIISLDPHNRAGLDAVERVVYHLHKTFKNPHRESRDRRRNFELQTAAWGEFTVRADVYLKSGGEPLHLSRYLDIRNGV